MPEQKGDPFILSGIYSGIWTCFSTLLLIQACGLFCFCPSKPLVNCKLFPLDSRKPLFSALVLKGSLVSQTVLSFLLAFLSETSLRTFSYRALSDLGINSQQNGFPRLAAALWSRCSFLPIHFMSCVFPLPPFLISQLGRRIAEKQEPFLFGSFYPWRCKVILIFIQASLSALPQALADCLRAFLFEDSVFSLMPGCFL